jgi:hypothetical protein
MVQREESDLNLLEDQPDASKFAEITSPKPRLNDEIMPRDSAIILDLAEAKNPIPTDQRVLIAEDQLINMAVLKQNLSELNILESCDYAYNGLEAVNKACEIIGARYEIDKNEKKSGTI